MAFRTGKLRHRVRIERQTFLQDSAGDPIQDEETGTLRFEWTPVLAAGAGGEVWANVDYLSAREFTASGANLSAAAARVEIRWFSGLLASDRFVHLKTDGNVILNPQGVLPDLDSGREYITIPVGVGANDG